MKAKRKLQRSTNPRHHLLHHHHNHREDETETREREEMIETLIVTALPTVGVAITLIGTGRRRHPQERGREIWITSAEVVEARCLHCHIEIEDIHHLGGLHHRLIRGLGGMMEVMRQGEAAPEEGLDPAIEGLDMIMVVRMSVIWEAGWGMLMKDLMDGTLVAHLVAIRPVLLVSGIQIVLVMLMLLALESTQREGLMSYKQFIQELEDDVLPAEAERRYQEYKSEYISTQKRSFFNAHKDEEWLKDKYHPTNLVTVIERRNELAQRSAKEFLLDLQSGTLDLGPGINASSNKSGQTGEQNTDDEVDINGKRRRNNRASAKDSDLLSAPKAHPVSSEPRRIQVDIKQAQALVRKLDFEKGVEENILRGSDNDEVNREKSRVGSTGPVIIIRGLTVVKGLEGTELLDTLITYLWRIHGLDYYGMVEKSEPKGLRHMRAEGKNSGITSNGEEWEKKIDSCWQGRLMGQDPLEIMTAKDKIDAAAAEGVEPYVRKIRDEKYGWKYGCGAKGCTKLFHASEFVHKHLKLKHPELVMELTVKVREELYFQNYMNDADAPGSTPVMQQTLPKDKLQRRRLNLDNRLKDDRGNRRERDIRANGSGRQERPEILQSGDFPPNNDGNDGGNPDEPPFDPYDEQGMHVAPPFPSDIAPPPVLMPVPGAGPLGPFVPAPPEVAMRMFREQGGPAPF
ncbi:Serrate RNA effector molecule-like protein [Quillaja saponaria]|uniref:Serrate RNA effector molecule-like protein n=1 Tax=Quillaja saponaria TaxID=32244 RepID=A0AAD7LLN7_QUISA|nr:Serrate RNA effector molecule-like protein [Quillaja saponaria]